MPEIIVDMACEKGRYNKGQAYVAFSHVTMLDQLFIKNYTREQICISENVEDEMQHFRENTLPPECIHDIDKVKCSDYLSILHLNAAGLLKMHLDIYSDDKWKKAHVVSFNKSWFNSSDTLSLKMIGLIEE